MFKGGLMSSRWIKETLSLYSRGADFIQHPYTGRAGCLSSAVVHRVARWLLIACPSNHREWWWSNSPPHVSWCQAVGIWRFTHFPIMPEHNYSSLSPKPFSPLWRICRRFGSISESRTASLRRLRGCSWSCWYLAVEEIALILPI